MANISPTPKAVALVLLPALVLMLAFAFAYVGAFHEPTPHHVPLAVVGPPAVSAQLNALPGAPVDARPVASRAVALTRIDDREVYGGYEVATNRLFVASAANRATAVALQRTFDVIAAGQRRPPPSVTDVKPLPLTDPNGTAAFYCVIAWMFGGDIGSTLIPCTATRLAPAASDGAADVEKESAACLDPRPDAVRHGELAKNSTQTAHRGGIAHHLLQQKTPPLAGPFA